ncbi:T9SS type A sorting domain-containing protein, partial [Marivirga sp. S37H4]
GSSEIATTATTTVSAPGTYTLEVTKESTGCTTTTTTTVGTDYSQPEGVVASNNGPLTCETLSVELTGSTTTTGVSYRWLSGSSEIATTATTTVSAPGTYTLEVTKESTGCTTTTTTTVGTDYSQPEGVVASNNGPLTCETLSVELTGSTTTAGVSYRWLSGSSEIATTATTTVSAPGTYTLEVTKESTGCTTTTTTTVGTDYSQPEGVVASNNGPLTCETTSVELTGSTTTTGVSYRWLKGSSEIATTATTTVSSPGAYTLEVTKESTGCTTTTTTTVGTDDSQQPVCSINVPLDPLEEFQEETLTAIPENDVSYSWSISGKGWAIISGENTPELVYVVGQGGTSATFTLTTQNNVTGCSNTCSITLRAEEEAFKQSLNNSNSFTMKSYPNPFIENTKIEFMSRKDDFVTVRLYTLNGVFINTLLKSEIRGFETYTVLIDGGDLHSGAYYCVITTRDKVYTKKLLLLNH